ncbi:molybdopterin molybdenumtransferase MoeA [Paracoccus sp. YIM 132242]|uniref:Molybdopterin molybdenumtransferase n=1 Tax=Paracoccus lichenicola TaxID=2665644 RepID=A0A6L6HJP8_9RHOB|nr:gephyrin-like molybdotransferase Glp [Paracoccus lichenicola]MTD99416.1 molybdopterin molybdenumtransferase MoeA [Paracoccus lichenicola]
MISVQQALEQVLGLAHPVASELIPIAEAVGRVLAEPAVSRITQPPFDASAMDGYAVRTADMDQPLTVIGEAAAGRPWNGQAAPGTAVRIFTGAAVPPGYDRVVMQEHVVRDGNRVRITDRSSGANIRKAGDDFQQSDRFAPARRLTASDIGLLAAMNIPVVAVAKRPRVAILAGGDELVAPGTQPLPGQIVSSNDLAIAALVRDAGADPLVLPIARDTEESLRAGFAAASGADLLVTIGGASVGDHDLVGKVAADLGLQRAFYKIAMRPGKPLMAGRLADMPMIGLPGNPVSAMVCGLLFVEPLIAAMQGLRPVHKLAKARLAVEMQAEGDRQHYLRATLEDGEDLPLIRPFSSQDSARLSLMAQADALLVRLPNDPPRRAGDIVSFLPLRG